MKRLSLALALAVLLLAGIAWPADESCTAGGVQCSKQIAASATNSEVSFGFLATAVSVRNASASANTVYVNFSTLAATADEDTSMPIAAGETVTVEMRTAYVNIITAAAGSATVQVDAFRER